MIERLKWKLVRLRYRWILWRDSGDALNRRVEVENVLWGVALGKRRLLAREECEELARKLGIERP